MKTKFLFAFIALLTFINCSINKHTARQTPKEITQARDDYERYILTYYPIAVEQMQKYNIPASITLAQGLLESGAGKSKLSRTSNNHFGIKADKSWNGKRTASMDNGHMCYFRKYKSVKESYEDHSKFLANRQRYAFLFKLDQDDYKGWSKGLKKAGYAEDPAYPNKLISLIERYELDQYDSYTMKDIKSAATEEPTRSIYKSNNLFYIIGNTGDTFESLSKEFGISRRKLVEYNDLYADYNIKAGDIIYLEKKNKKATVNYPYHTVQQGESLHSISQKYGVRMGELYNKNKYIAETGINVGDIIIMR